MVTLPLGVVRTDTQGTPTPGGRRTLRWFGRTTGCPAVGCPTTGRARSARAPMAGRRRGRPRARRAAHGGGTPDPIAWGHSAADYPVRLAELAGSRSVLLFHHDPTRTDRELAAIVGSFASAPVPVAAAAEGTVLDLQGSAAVGLRVPLKPASCRSTIRRASAGGRRRGAVR